MKILILKPSSLGDVIHALPVLRLLKRHRPHAARAKGRTFDHPSENFGERIFVAGRQCFNVRDVVRTRGTTESRALLTAS